MVGGGREAGEPSVVSAVSMNRPVGAGRDLGVGMARASVWLQEKRSGVESAEWTSGAAVACH